MGLRGVWVCVFCSCVGGYSHRIYTGIRRKLDLGLGLAAEECSGRRTRARVRALACMGAYQLQLHAQLCAHAIPAHMRVFCVGGYR